MGKFIILVGVTLVIVGVLITLKVPLSWIGNLPGDFVFMWGSTRLYVPIATSIILSLLLSVLLFIFARH